MEGDVRVPEAHASNSCPAGRCGDGSRVRWLAVRRSCRWVLGRAGGTRAATAAAARDRAATVGQALREPSEIAW